MFLLTSVSARNRLHLCVSKLSACQVRSRLAGRIWVSPDVSKLSPYIGLDCSGLIVPV